MSNIGQELVTLLQYLLPGFLAAWVYYGLTSFSVPSQFERVVQALIFTLLVQALVFVAKSGLLAIGRYWALASWSEHSELITSVAYAFFLGAAFAAFANNDKFHALMRKAKITRETSIAPRGWPRGLRACVIVGVVAVVTTGCMAGPWTLQRPQVLTQDVLDFPADISAAALAVGEGYVWVLGIEQKGPDRRPAWLYKVDPATMTFVGAPIAVGTASDDYAWGCSPMFSPFCSVAVGEGAIWVAHSGGLWRLDPLGERAVTWIPVRVASVSTGEGAVWAVSPNAVHSIDPRTAEVVATIPLESARQVTVGGGAVWVTTGRFFSGALVRIDPKTKEVGATIPIDGTPWGLAFGHGAVWVAGGVTHHELFRVDPRIDQVVASIFLCHGGPKMCGRELVQGVVVNPQAVWAGRTRRFFQIDPATNQVSGRTDFLINTDDLPIAVTAGEGVIWLVRWRQVQVGGSLWFPTMETRHSLMRWRIP